MPVRSTMLDLISRTRALIGDPAGAVAQFDDQTLQDYLDENRDDVRYEPLHIAPAIVNNASTNNQATTIFSDYYSRYGWWEQDVVLQAYSGGQAWVVVTPAVSDYITGHWQFEASVFTNTTVPGQLPPVFATGKVYDRYAAAADLLDMWGATLAGAYDVTVNGQSLRRSQLMTAKLALAEAYRKRATMCRATIRRSDLAPELDTVRIRLLDSTGGVKGW